MLINRSTTMAATSRRTLALSVLLLALLNVSTAKGMPPIENEPFFKECAEANGLDLEKMKERHHKRHREDADGPPEGPPPPLPSSHQPPPPEEFMCTKKCVLEKSGILKDGKLELEEIFKHPMMRMHSNNNRDVLEDCLKSVEISSCVDMKKIFDCKRSAHPPKKE